MNKKPKKSRRVNNEIRVRSEIVVVCDECGGPVPAKRGVIGIDRRTSLALAVAEIKVGRCPKCDLKMEEKMEAIKAIDDAFKNLFGLNRKPQQPGRSGVSNMNKLQEDPFEDI